MGEHKEKSVLNDHSKEYLLFPLLDWKGYRITSQCLLPTLKTQTTRTVFIMSKHALQQHFGTRGDQLSSCSAANKRYL